MAFRKSKAAPRGEKLLFPRFEAPLERLALGGIIERLCAVRLVWENVFYRHRVFVIQAGQLECISFKPLCPEASVQNRSANWIFTEAWVWN